MKIKKYKKEYNYTYAQGSFVALNLINSRPREIICVYAHDKLASNSLNLIEEACRQKNIRLQKNANKIVERLRDKESELVIAAFNKFESELDFSQNHIVLDNPSDMGNLGTILRTGLGFNYKNFALIGNPVDHFNPKLIRASMGAVFDVKIQKYSNFEDYSENFGVLNRDIYCFMLGGTRYLKDIKVNNKSLHSLIFGNESSGLDKIYSEKGNAIMIKHNDFIDSLNLSTAASIAMHHFSS